MSLSDFQWVSLIYRQARELCLNQKWEMCAMNQENVKRARFQSIIAVLWCLHVFNQTGIKNYCPSARNFTLLSSEAAALLLECYWVLTGGETFQGEIKWETEALYYQWTRGAHWCVKIKYCVAVIRGSCVSRAGLGLMLRRRLSPPPSSSCFARQRCRTTLSWFQLRGETLWFSASVSPSCVGFFLVWRPCEPSTELELFPPPNFLFFCKRNFLQGANMVGEDIILVGKSSLLMF